MVRHDTALIDRLFELTTRLVACLAAAAALTLSPLGAPPALAATADEAVPTVVGDVSLQLPQLEDLIDLPGIGDQLKGHWRGLLDGVEVRIAYRVYPLDRFGFRDPVDVIMLLENNYSRRNEDFAFTSDRTVRGPFGRAPFAAIATSALPGAAGQPGEMLFLGAILDDIGYSIEVHVYGDLAPARRQVLVDFLEKGVSSTVPPWDPDWTIEEIQARWQRDVPFDPKGMQRPIRTKHFLVLTNTRAAGKLFGKKMEESYAKVQKMFPFAEEEGARLLPVFIFKTREQYYQYYMHIAGTDRASAEQSKGHAWKDYYATYYESPQDPVHIHEATHQIFANRLRLRGGGSWFQEGVAEYCSTSTNDRKAFARRHAKDRKHIPFRKFVQIPRLISNPYLNSENSYLQAASLTEFLCDKWNEDKFPEFIRTVGALPRGDDEQVDAALQSIYGVDLDGLEEAWLKYWSRR